MEDNKKLKDVSNKELLHEIRMLRQDMKEMNWQIILKFNEQFLALQSDIRLLKQTKAHHTMFVDTEDLFTKSKSDNSLFYNDEASWNEASDEVKSEQGSPDNLLQDSNINKKISADSDDSSSKIPPVVLEVTTTCNTDKVILQDDNDSEDFQGHSELDGSVLHENISPYNCISKHMYDESTHIANCTDRHCMLCKSLCVSKYPDNSMSEHKSQWRCAVCQRYFRRKYNLKNHMRCHTGEKPYQCCVCKHHFRSKQALNYHSHKHDRNYQTKKKVSKSNNTHHQSDCDASDKADIADSDDLRLDICESQLEDSVTGQDVYKTMYISQNVKEPMANTVSGKPWKCPVCGKFFQRKANVKNHMRIHTGEKPYVCKECGKDFAVLYSLKIHQKNS